MKATILAAAALITLGALGSARAADMPPPVYKAPPPPAPVYNWTGCYINAGGGYGMWNQDHYAEFGPPIFTTGGFDPVSVTYTNGGRGWLGTFGGGCDYQTPLFNNRVVIGVFGDYDPMSLTGTNESQLPITRNIADISGSETETGAWYVGGRIGYLVTPTLLTYFEGGYTQARFGQVNFSSEFPAIPLAIAYSLPGTTSSGWFLGSGIEYALTWLPIQGLFWRSEYRYASYEAQDVPLVFTSTGTQSGYYEHSQKYVQTATTSLVWRFNFGGN